MARWILTISILSAVLGFGGGPAFSGGAALGADPETPELLPTRTVNDPSGDDPSRDSQLTTAVVDLGRGKLVAAFHDSNSVLAGNTLHRIGYAWSSNGGKTWIDGGTLPDSATGDLDRPSLAYSQKTKQVYLSVVSFASADINIFRSNDKGHTWLTPVDAAPGAVGQVLTPWIATDNVNGPGYGNVYVCWTDFIAGIGTMRLTRSTDGGNTFGPSGGVPIAAKGFGCTVVTGPKHEVYVFYYAGDGADGYSGQARLYMRRSLDGGVTFDPETKIADLSSSSAFGSLNLNAGEVSNAIPQAAVNPDPKRGHIYVVYNDDPTPGDNTDNGDIFLVRSNNRGLTWSAPVRINDDRAGDQFRPSVAFAENGSLMFGYYSRSHDKTLNILFHHRGRLGVLTGKNGKKLKLYRSFQMSANSPSLLDLGSNLPAVYDGYYDVIAGRGPWFTSTFSTHQFGNALHEHQSDVLAGRIAAAPHRTDLRVRLLGPKGKIKAGKTAKVVAEVTAGDARTGNAARDAFLHLDLIPGVKIQSVKSKKCSKIRFLVDCNLGPIGPGQTKSVVLKVVPTIKPKVKIAAYGTTSDIDLNARNSKAKASIKVAVGNTVTQTFSTGDIAVAISDYTTVEIPLNVPAGGAMLYALPQVRLNHSYDRDLILSLITPGGAEIILSNRRGGSQNDYGSGGNDCAGIPTVFDDFASVPVWSGTAPFAGTFIPEEPLANVAGPPSTGTWKLRVSDNASLDTGTVGCFKLTVTRRP